MGIVMPAFVSSPEEREMVAQRVVLVVEDDVVLRSSLSDYLRDRGFAVIEAANADEALAVFASRTLVDLVFSDVNMPGSMDGFALARWIAEHDAGIPVVLASGVAKPQDAGPHVLPGRFVAKPYSYEEVDELIRALMRPTDHSRHG